MKGNKRISLLAVLACVFALVFSLGIMSACGNSESASNEGGQWLYGTTAPAENLGNTGDYYLNTETLTAYVRTADGEWQQTALYSGTAAPDNADGQLGDLYLDTKNGVLYQKGSELWSIVLTLKDQSGRDGVVWFSGKTDPKVGDTALKDAIAGDFYLNTTDFSVWQLNADKTAWNPLGSIMGRGTTWFDGTLTPEKADLKDVYEGDYYYRTFIDDEAKAEKYQIYRFENKAWTLKADVITADLSALYAPDGESYFNDNGDTVVLENSDKTATEVTIPGSYNGKSVEIGANAFKDNTNLQSVTIEEGVTKIGDDAFNRCSNLESANIPDTVTSIGINAFNACGKITEIKIPNSVTTIGRGAFNSCSNLTNVTFEEGTALTRLESSIFSGCSKLESIDIPDTVTSIGNNAFNVCRNLKEIEIPQGVTSIESSAFASCGIQSISIPDGVTALSGNVFEGCFALESVKLPENLTSIGASAFRSCPQLLSITIPKKVTSIQMYAFYMDYHLVEIINHSSLKFTKGAAGFMDPNGNIAQYALGIETAPDAQSKVVEDGNGFMFYMGEDETYLVAYHGESATLNIPETAPEGKAYKLNQYAFYAEAVTSVTFPENMTEIAEHAFANCELRTVTIPNGITTIGANAFSSCLKLTNVAISETVTSIGDSAFYACTNLANLTIQGNGEGLTIEAGAMNVSTGLKTITFGGTAEEFANLLTRGNFLSSIASVTVTCNGGTYTFAEGVRQS